MKGGIQIMILVLLAAAAAALTVVMGSVIVPDETDAHRCNCGGFSHDCGDCDSGRCCSPAGYCGSTDPYCTPCKSAHICDCYPEYCREPAAVAQAQKLDQDHTTKSHFNNNDTDDDDDNTIVATYDRNFTSTDDDDSNNMLVAWRSNYGWAKLCRSSTSTSSTSHVSSKADDGAQCFKVTNGENGKQAVLRIMDNNNSQKCTSSNINNATNLMLLDYAVFHQLSSHNTAAFLTLPQPFYDSVLHSRLPINHRSPSPLPLPLPPPSHRSSPSPVASPSPSSHELPIKAPVAFSTSSPSPSLGVVTYEMLYGRMPLQGRIGRSLPTLRFHFSSRSRDSEAMFVGGYKDHHPPPEPQDETTDTTTNKIDFFTDSNMASAASKPQELTLSYLCEHNNNNHHSKLGLGLDHKGK
ncbi:Wound-induced protein WIN2 [Linum perenne]